jgi:hypothetical protein
MKGKVALGIIAFFVFASYPMAVTATSTAHQHDQAITGCLQSDGGSGQYQIIGQDGATWSVRAGEYVDLSSYVGRTVTVAGPETKSHSMKSAKAEDQVTALDVAVDNDSCHR